MKSQLPIKLLTNEIRVTLSADGLADSAKDTAQRFSTHCDDLNNRLNQCFNASSAKEGVLLAEESDPLLDSIEVIEKFSLYEEWLEFCDQYNLESPKRIESGSFDRLMSLYKEWSGSADFLRKKYRDAAIRKDEPVLLSCLGKILKIDPTDEAAKDETRRILRRHFRDEIKELDEIVQSEDKSNAMAVVDRLDQLPFDELKKGESWEKAMHWLNAERKASDEKIAFRLISNLSNQCEQRKLDAVKNSIEEIEAIIKKHNIVLDHVGQETIEDSKKWIKDEIELLDKEEKSKDIRVRFDKIFKNLDSNFSVVLKSPLNEIETARRKLTNSWAEFEKIGLLPEGGIDQKVAEFKEALDKRILKLKKKIRRKRLTKISTVSFVIFFLSYFGFAQWKSKAILAEFDGYKKIRSARPFEKLYKSTKTYNWPVAFLARMGPDLKKAYGWLTIELDKYNLLVDDINRLGIEADSGFGRPINEYWEEFQDLELGISETATDLKKELNEQKSILQNKWDNHRSNYIATQRARRRVALEEVKKILTNKPNITKVSRDVEYVKNIHSINKELTDSMKVVIPPAFVNDEVKEEFRERGAQLSARIDKIDSLLATIDQLKAVQNYADFKLAMKNFENEKFEGTLEHSTSNAFFSNTKDFSDVIGEVLRPGQSLGWTVYYQNRNKDQIFPKNVEEAERVVLNGISNYRKYLNLHKCFFIEIPSGKTFYKFCDGPTKLRNRKVGPNSIIERSGYFFDDTKFIPLKFELFDSGKFELKDEQLKKAKGITLRNEEVTPESEMFNLILPSKRLMSQSQQYYKEGILGVFDDINRDDSDPLFRAFLISEFSKVVMRRSHEWGLLMVPDFLKDLDNLKRTKPPIFGRHDWMVESRYTEEKKALGELFSGIAEKSYLTAFKVNKALVESVIESGFEYAGFTDHRGALNLLEKANDTNTLYGSSQPDKYATALFTKSSDDGNWQPQGSISPFTPLICFKGDKKKSIQLVADSLNMTEEEVKAYAIPFFLTD